MMNESIFSDFSLRIMENSRKTGLLFWKLKIILTVYL